MIERKAFLALALVGLLLAAATAEAATHSKRWIGFDKHKNDSWYNQWHARQDFGNTRWFANHNARIKDRNFLRIKLPRNKELEGFKAVAAILPAPARTCVAKIRFTKGFDFGDRNDIKIPCGLGGGTLPTGGNLDRKNGWTARFVIIGANRHIGVYAYHAEQDRVYGEFFDTGITARDNQWYTLKLHARKNSYNKRNGTLIAHVNGRKRIHRAMKWSVNPKNADTIFMTTFRGGGGSPPTRDTYIDVDYLQWF